MIHLFARAAPVGALTVFADQALKVAVGVELPLCPDGPLGACARLGVAGPLALVRVENAGGVFGFGQGHWGWPLLGALGLLLVLLYARLLPPGWSAALAVELLVGGGLSNLLDRLRVGAGVDYLHVTPLPVVFNLADVALVAGVLLVIPSLRQGQGAACGRTARP